MYRQSSKHELRESALARRKSVSAGERLVAGDQLARAAAQMIDAMPRRTTVAAYVSMGSEIPTQPLIGSLLGNGHRVLVPRLGSGLDIGWSGVEALTSLQSMPRRPSGGLRPSEPANLPQGAETLSEASIIIIPALAVDRSGTRLGRGGGWYDRALPYRCRDARVIAVCWPWELSDATLPREPHDVSVGEALTTVGLTRLDIRPARPGSRP